MTQQAQEYGAPKQIEPKSLDDYLEVMSKSVFQSGMSWRVIESKWPGIREAFLGFDVNKVANMGDGDIDELAKDTRVIRNRRKLEAIVSNANKLIALEKQHGSPSAPLGTGFKNYLRSHANFDATVAALRKEFKFLGDSGCYIMLYVVGEQVPPHEEWMAAHGRSM